MSSKIKKNVHPSNIFDEQILKLRKGVDSLIEFTWLAGLLLTPLVFSGRNWFFHFTEPKQNVIHLTALVLICLWVFDIALTLTADGKIKTVWLNSKTWFLGAWRNPYKLALIFCFLYILGGVITLLLSPIPQVSFFGRNVNDPGADFYTVASVFVIFLTIAIRVSSRQQFERILYAIAITGILAVVYGFFQIIGWDFLSFNQEQFRIGSSFGNPLSFSSYIVLALYVAVVILAIHWGRSKSRYWVGIVSIVAFTGAISTIFSTGSRGPLVAIVCGAIFMIAAYLLVNPGVWKKVRAISLVATSPIIWFVNAYADGDFANPVFIVGYLVVLGLTVAVFFYEWRETKQTIITAVFFIAVLATQSVVLFALADASVVLDIAYSAFPLLISAIYFFLNNSLDWTGHPFQGKLTIMKTVTIASLRDTRVVIASGLFIILFFALLFANFSQGVDRLNIELRTTSGNSSSAIGETIFQEDDSGENLDDGFVADESATVIGQRALIPRAADAEEDGFAENIDSLFTGRIEVWGSALEIGTTRISTFDENAGTKILRHIFGHGQEMYFLASPLTLPPRQNFELFAHPHNLFLLIWVEQGIWGLLTYIGFLVSIGACAGSIFFRYTKRFNKDGVWYLLLTIGLSAAVIANLVNQMSNLARVSDYLLFWVIFALILALYRLHQSKDSVHDNLPSVKKGTKNRKKHLGDGKIYKYGWRFWVPATSFLSVTALALTLFIVVDVATLYHSSGAVEAFQIASTNDDSEDNQVHYARVGEASLAHPLNDIFVIEYASLIDITGIDTNNATDEEIRLIGDSIEVFENHLANSPNSVNGLQNLINSKLIYILTGNYSEELADSLQQNMEDLLAAIPAYTEIVGELSTRQVIFADNLRLVQEDPVRAQRGYLGALESANVALEGARELRLSVRDIGTALYTQAYALEQLGRYDEAIAAFEEWLSVDPHNRTFGVLNLVSLTRALEMSGQAEKAMLYTPFISELSQYVSTRRMFWLRDYIAGNIINLAGGDAEQVITSLKRYENGLDGHILYDEYTEQVLNFLVDMTEQNGYPTNVTACYRDNADLVRAFFDKGGYETEGNTPPTLEICSLDD